MTLYEKMEEEREEGRNEIRKEFLIEVILDDRNSGKSYAEVLNHIRSSYASLNTFSDDVIREIFDSCK